MVESASGWMMAPIIVTALMGAEDFAWADGLRRAHFPAERNFVPAHITLFHHLPPSLISELTVRIKGLCARRRPAAAISGVRLLGRAVAYEVQSQDLMAMRDELADAFAGLLAPQDQARPRLHITVQNKVETRQAQTLAERLQKEFRPRKLEIAGLAAWLYRDGPWEMAMKANFRG